MKYMVGNRDEWLQQNPEAKTLPVIVPVVVHHSDTGWTAATALEELFDATESVRAALGEHALRMRFILEDVSKLGDDVLRARAMTSFGRVVLWSLRDARNGDALIRGLAVWADLLREVSRSPGGQDALLAFGSYVCEVLDLSVTEFEEIVVTAVSDEVENTMASVADRLRAEGMARGRREARLDTLRTLLRHKFGVLTESAESRLASASERDLEQWTLRTLDAKTLADVLGDA